MRQLSGLDASFLVLETPNAPMHVGSVLLFEPPRGRRFDFEHYRDAIAARLHVSRVFRQRLLEVPFDLGRPFWVEDPGFDLDFHVHHMALPRPGGFRELARLAGHVYTIPLDRSRPLWEMTFVEGVDAVPGVKKGAFAIISKVHHAGIDGMSGAEVLGALLDVDPDAPPPEATRTWKPERVPSDLELIARATGSAIEPLRLASLVARTVTATLASGGGARPQVAGLKPPPAPFQAPQTRLNVPLTPRRSWCATRFPLERLRALRSLVDGATVNDVVLAVVGGAFRRYLEERGHLPAESLVAMAPVSVRREDEKGSLGNQISAMLVRLGTDEADPLERLRRVQAGAARTKGHHKGVGARTLADYTHFVPFSMAGLAARLYTRMEVARLHRPIFNVIVTNVPGPQVPLYFAGARLAAAYGAGPVFDGVGVILVVFSYAGDVSVSVTACRAVMPDGEAFCAHLDDAVAELERQRPRGRRPRPVPAPTAARG